MMPKHFEAAHEQLDYWVNMDLIAPALATAVKTLFEAIVATNYVHPETKTWVNPSLDLNVLTGEVTVDWRHLVVRPIAVIFNYQEERAFLVDLHPKAGPGVSKHYWPIMSKKFHSAVRYQSKPLCEAASFGKQIARDVTGYNTYTANPSSGPHQEPLMPPTQARFTETGDPLAGYEWLFESNEVPPLPQYINTRANRHRKSSTDFSTYLTGVAAALMLSLHKVGRGMMITELVSCSGYSEGSVKKVLHRVRDHNLIRTGGLMRATSAQASHDGGDEIVHRRKRGRPIHLYALTPLGELLVEVYEAEMNWARRHKIPQYAVPVQRFAKTIMSIKEYIHA